jgi:hypothetical protein
MNATQNPLVYVVSGSDAETGIIGIHTTAEGTLRSAGKKADDYAVDTAIKRDNVEARDQAEACLRGGKAVVGNIYEEGGWLLETFSTYVFCLLP